MITKITGGIIIAETQEIKADLYIEDGKITDITTKELYFDEEISAEGKYVAPAFVDIHTHGADGYDFLDNTEEAYLKIAKAHAKHGAGTIIPTITSAGKESILSCINAFKEAQKHNQNGVNMPGLHLEGPYFSPAQAGAQDPDKIRDFDENEYMDILSESDCILRWTGAPELDGSEEFGKILTKKGILPCIGHSDADSDCVKKAFENGFTHVTHLYSCTSTVHRKNAYRYAGIVESAYLNDEMTVEIIADGVHLPADLLKLVYKIKGADKIALITDSMRGAGMPDGFCKLGGKEDGLDVIIENGVAKLPDRSAFAGSVAFCDRLVRNMVNLAEVSLVDTIKMASTTPAKILGLNRKGKIEKGYDADIVFFDENITISKTIIGGKVVYSG